MTQKIRSDGTYGSAGQRPKGHPLKRNPCRIPNRPPIDLEKLIDYRSTCVATANHYRDEMTDEQRYLLRRECVWVVWQFRKVSASAYRAWRGRMFWWSKHRDIPFTNP